MFSAGDVRRRRDVRTFPIGGDVLEDGRGVFLKSREEFSCEGRVTDYEKS